VLDAQHCCCDIACTTTITANSAVRAAATALRLKLLNTPIASLTSVVQNLYCNYWCTEDMIIRSFVSTVLTSCVSLEALDQDILQPFAKVRWYALL
jgi:hypothetical protein